MSGNSPGREGMDQRVARTRGRLGHALMQLGQTQDLDSIRIGDLVRVNLDPMYLVRADAPVKGKVAVLGLTGMFVLIFLHVPLGVAMGVAHASALLLGVGAALYRKLGNARIPVILAFALFALDDVHAPVVGEHFGCGGAEACSVGPWPPGACSCAFCT